MLSTIHPRACTLALASLLFAGATPLRGQHHEHPPHTGLPAVAAEQIAAVRTATERYRDHAAAVADGYVLFGRESPLMGEHWYRRDLVRRPLDLEHPSTLQYALVDGRRTLVGVAYTVYRAPDDPLPEGFAGDADVWHVHDVARIGYALTEGRPLLRRVVQRAQRRRAGAAAGRTHLTMLHAWVWLDNPAGIFAQAHPALPYLRAGLPAAWADGRDAASAEGAGLLDGGACAREVARLHAVARLDRAQRSTLETVCDASAARVEEARMTGAGRDAFNAAARSAWQDYAAIRDGVLTDEQQSRLAALVEHDGMGGHH